jgi:hypothetical protein
MSRTRSTGGNFSELSSYSKRCSHRNQRRNARSLIRELVEDYEESQHDDDCEENLLWWEDDFQQALFEEDDSWMDEFIEADYDPDYFVDPYDDYNCAHGWERYTAERLSKQLMAANLRIVELERELLVLKGLRVRA